MARVFRFFYFNYCPQLVDFMERETGIEPATFSLGMWPSIENKEHSVHLDLVLAIENTGVFESVVLQKLDRAEIEQKEFGIGNGSPVDGTGFRRQFLRRLIN